MPNGDPYDEILYLSSAFASSRPDNLSVIGTLSGLNPAPPDACRVLEIGCAAGRNLTPMAQALPGSQFLGIDLSGLQIDHAKSVANQAQLNNIEFQQADILTFEDTGKFDYIIAHGIYSWVPRHVRDKMLEICSRNLTPNGLVYISYNTYPGWHLKQVTRDMMLYHSRKTQSGTEKLKYSKEILASVLAAQGNTRELYGKVIADLAPQLIASKEWYLAHDDLEAVSEPVYFHQFVEHAAAFGLQYIGAAEPLMNLAGKIPKNVLPTLQKSCGSNIELEQYADFIFGTQYRASILCSNQVKASNPAGLNAVPGLRIAAPLLEGFEKGQAISPNQVRFFNPLSKHDVVTTNTALIPALRTIAAAWPHAVPFSDLLNVASGVAQDMSREQCADLLARGLLAAYSTETIEFWTRSTDFLADGVPDFPKASPLARNQAQNGGPLISTRHHEFNPVDALVKKIVPLMDGTRSRNQIFQALADALKEKEFSLLTPNGPITSRNELKPIFEQAIRTFAMHSFLLK